MAERKRPAAASRPPRSIERELLRKGFMAQCPRCGAAATRQGDQFVCRACGNPTEFCTCAGSRPARAF